MHVLTCLPLVDEQVLLSRKVSQIESVRFFDRLQLDLLKESEAKNTLKDSATIQTPHFNSPVFLYLHLSQGSWDVKHWGQKSGQCEKWKRVTADVS